MKNIIKIYTFLLMHPCLIMALSGLLSGIAIGSYSVGAARIMFGTFAAVLLSDWTPKVIISSAITGMVIGMISGICMLIKNNK